MSKPIRLLILTLLIGTTVFTILSIQLADPNDKIQYVNLRFPDKNFDAAGQIRALLSRNPQDDAMTAFRTHDRRFVGIFGITAIAPGTKILRKIDPAFLSTNDFKIINGTADYSRSPITIQINYLAYEYAEKYNYFLITLIFKGNVLLTNEADWPARSPQ